MSLPRTGVPILLAAAACLALVGCGSVHRAGPAPADSSDVRLSAEPASEYGLIAGVVWRSPCRDPRSGSAGGVAIPVAGDPITVRDAAGRTAAQAVTRVDGSYQVLMRPGTYRVIEGVAGVGASATVAAGSAATVDLTIPAAPGGRPYPRVLDPRPAAGVARYPAFRPHATAAVSGQRAVGSAAWFCQLRASRAGSATSSIG
jgi:hypothetical protein